MNAKPKPRTLADIFFRDRGPQPVPGHALRARLRSGIPSLPPASTAGSWESSRRSAATASRHGDRVAILAENRPEWTIADFAILLVGAATVPIYATLTAEQISFLLRHSGARTAFVSTAAQLAKLRSIQAETLVETIILMDEPAPDDGALSMPALMDAGPAAARTRTRCPRHSIDPGRPGHAHLHQRHHRHSQGRHAHPRQHRLQSLALPR